MLMRRLQYCLTTNVGTQNCSSPLMCQVACCCKYSLVLLKVLNVFCIGVFLKIEDCERAFCCAVLYCIWGSMLFASMYVFGEVCYLQVCISRDLPFFFVAVKISRSMLCPHILLWCCWFSGSIYIHVMCAAFKFWTYMEYSHLMGLMIGDLLCYIGRAWKNLI
jgi:hypothetical protein